MVLPLEELLSELILHMLDLREPSELGLLGGVWNDQLLSDTFRSAITCNNMRETLPREAQSIKQQTVR